MTNIIEQKADIYPCPYNEINKTKPVFVCYDFELETRKVTTSLKEAIRFCKENNCQYSEYSIGTYERFIRY